MNQIRCYLAEIMIQWALRLFPKGSKEGRLFATAALGYAKEIKRELESRHPRPP